jgi:hypothetical protein
VIEYTSTGSEALIVEDPFICSYVQAILIKHGWHAVKADTTRALEILRSADHKIGVLITNNPAAFVPYAADVPLIYMAAMPDKDLPTLFFHHRVLQKPFTPDQLVEAIDDLTGEPAEVS